MTMNSVSPVAPLDARRMCSRSERFITAQDAHPLVLRHDDRERAAVPHTKSVFTAVRQRLEHPGQTARMDEIKPLCERILGMQRIIRISETLFNPCDDKIEL